ncbi:related to Protein OCA4 [Saccharomycodes ludwigii]|uniref:Related to Protein OCA4 n=1 Tax=Saccharomycodes ludwigii TaxID=36035 RepID=A0A376B4G9_9ASCO|nr:related to Protein OCA4 [Saccharomycodes ludwigii]
MLVPPANFGIVEEGIYRCSKIETLNLSFLETLNLKTLIFLSEQEPSKFFKEFFKSWKIEWIVINNNNTQISPIPENPIISAINNNSFSKEDNEPDTADEAITETNSGNDKKNKNNTSKIASSSKEKETESKILSDYVRNYYYSEEFMLIKPNCLQKIIYLLLDTNNYNTLLVDKTSIIVGLIRKLSRWNISSIINEYRLFTGKNSNYYSEIFLELVQINITQNVEEDKQDVVNKRKDLEGKPTIKSNTGSNYISSTVHNGNERNYNRKKHNSRNNRPTKKKVERIKLTDQDLMKPPQVPETFLLTLINNIEQHEFQEKVPKNAVDEKTNTARPKSSGRSTLLSPSAFNPSSITGGSKNKKMPTELINSDTYRIKPNKNKKTDYEYYKSCCTNIGPLIELRIPKEKYLPRWFKTQRDTWEKENTQDFFTESIYG